MTVDPAAIDRCGLGQPHEPHQVAPGKPWEAPCAGLTAEQLADHQRHLRAAEEFYASRVTADPTAAPQPDHSATLADWLEYRQLPPDASLADLIEAERGAAKLAAGFELLHSQAPTTAPQPATPGEAIDLDAIDPTWDGTCDCEDKECHEVDCRQGHGPWCPVDCYSRYGCPIRLVAEVRRLRGEWHVLTDRWGHYKRQYLGALEETERLRGELAEVATERDHLRQYAETVRHHQQSSSEGWREVERLRGELERTEAARANLQRNAEILAGEVVLGNAVVTPELDAAPAADPGVPGVYRLPAEPPAGVLWDRKGDRWDRDGNDPHHGYHFWRRERDDWVEHFPTVLARLYPLSTTPPAGTEQPETWRCRRCGSDRWLGWRAGPERDGYPLGAQCVPCGHVQATPPAGTEGDDAD